MNTAKTYAQIQADQDIESLRATALNILKGLEAAQRHLTEAQRLLALDAGEIEKLTNENADELRAAKD